VVVLPARGRHREALVGDWALIPLAHTGQLVPRWLRRRWAQIGSHDRERLRQEEFFVDVAHELRLPLTTIRISVEVLVEALVPELPEQLRRLLLNVDHESQRLGTMIDDLLDLNRIQAGHTHFRPRPCDLRNVASGAVRAIAPLAEQRGQLLRLELPRRTSVECGGRGTTGAGAVEPARKCAQVWTPGGKLLVCLQTRRREALFSVTDDGPGIAAADRERIFERRYRSPTADGRRVQGSGLGLPLCRAAVELHGGHVWAEDAPEQGGSVFRIALPLRYPRCQVEADEHA
jgi:signal transduction histidine kinase